ncbi:MAG: glycosyltransferase family 2 protein [Anaerolineae bacterium]|nr:glycosyltransferase family 2 protein [Anaerolineae bacterium]
MQERYQNQHEIDRGTRENGVDFSVVIPVYNEVDSLPVLHEQLHDALNGLDRTWEVVYIDDGSSDGSAEVLAKLAEKNRSTTNVVGLRRNFGQTAAIAAGIDFASGEIIVLMDADLQNDPIDIPVLLEKIEEGYDLVSGWRKRRKDTFLTRTLPSRMANWLISVVTGVRLHDYGCTLKAYRREVLTGYRLYGEMHRFIPAYAGHVGARVTEIPVRHHARKYGETKYGLERTFKVILDLFTVKYLISFVHKPIYLFGGTGAGLMAAGTLGVVYLLVRKYTVGGVVADSPIFLASLISFLMGFQAILMGLLAEVMARTYHESQAKPTYNVRWTVQREQPE